MKNVCKRTSCIKIERERKNEKKIMFNKALSNSIIQSDQHLAYIIKLHYIESKI